MSEQHPYRHQYGRRALIRQAVADARQRAGWYERLEEDRAAFLVLAIVLGVVLLCMVIS